MTKGKLFSIWVLMTLGYCIVGVVLTLLLPDFNFFNVIGYSPATAGTLYVVWENFRP